MPFYQCDASGLVKRYVDEVGSDWVRAIVDPAAANIVSIADITRAEVTSALARRAREGIITLDERDELIQTFRAHCATQYRIVPTQPWIIDLAIELLQRHPLRAYDAVQKVCFSITRLHTEDTSVLAHINTIHFHRVHLDFSSGSAAPGTSIDRMSRRQVFRAASPVSCQITLNCSQG